MTIDDLKAAAARVLAAIGPDRDLLCTMPTKDPYWQAKADALALAEFVSRLADAKILSTRVEYTCNRSGEPSTMTATFDSRDDFVEMAEAFVRSFGSGSRSCDRLVRVVHRYAVEVDAATSGGNEPAP